MDLKQYESRKQDHLIHALNPAHQAQGLGGLDAISLTHEALPDLNFEEIHLESKIFGKTLATPLYIAGMTAGHEEAGELNQVLAQACQKRGWIFGVGSQRRELEEGGSSPDWDQWPALRERAPGALFIANLGISQVIQTPPRKIRPLLEKMGADALVIHFNALQEVIQPEGTPHFRGVWEALRRIEEELQFPWMIKETGCGFSERTLQKLAELVSQFSFFKAVDVSGLGGTHWGRIEGARSPQGSIFSEASRTFADWGIPTTESVLSAVRSLPRGVEVWASGGVRSGLDAAKLIALGAHRVGYAQAALQAARSGSEALHSWMEAREYELRVALFCTGCRSPEELRQKEKVWNRNRNL